ncbi:MAG: hypothetical protein K6G47_12765 [Clostridia bacterium]|nr:hypothetical protein [Clostridia bacterium]
MKRIKFWTALILVTAILFSAVGCSAFGSKSKSKGKDKDDDGDFKEKDVIALAEDFGEALVNGDYEALCDISDADDPSDLQIDIEYTEDTWNVVRAWHDTFTYEVDEDSVEIDDDEATVSLDIIYADVDSLDVSDKSVDGWKEALEDAEETDSKTLELSMKYDDDDEKLIVEDAIDVVSDYYSISASFDIESIDYSLALDVNIDAYYTNEDIVITVTCDEISAANGKEVNVSVNDPAGNELLNETFEFSEGAEETYTIEIPSSGAFEEGFYNVTTLIGGSMSYYSFMLVAPEAEPTPTNDGGDDEIISGLDSTFTAPPDEARGVYDVSADTYTNEYFGFVINLNQNFMSFEGDTFSDASDEAAQGIDLVSMYMGSTTNTNGDLNMAIIMILQAESDTTQVFQMLSVTGDAENVDINGVSMLCADNKGVPIYVMTKDDCVLFITFSSDDTDMIDTFLDGVEPV